MLPVTGEFAESRRDCFLELGHLLISIETRPALVRRFFHTICVNRRRLARPNLRRVDDADVVRDRQLPRITHPQMIPVRHRHANLGDRRAGIDLKPLEAVSSFILAAERLGRGHLGQLQQPAALALQLGQAGDKRLGDVAPPKLGRRVVQHLGHLDRSLSRRLDQPLGSLDQVNESHEAKHGDQHDHAWPTPLGDAARLLFYRLVTHRLFQIHPAAKLHFEAHLGKHCRLDPCAPVRGFFARRVNHLNVIGLVPRHHLIARNTL